MLGPVRLGCESPCTEIPDITDRLRCDTKQPRELRAGAMRLVRLGLVKRTCELMKRVTTVGLI